MKKFFVIVTALFLLPAPIAPSDTNGQCENDPTCESKLSSSNDEESSFAPLGPPDEFVMSSQPGVRLAVRRWTPSDQEINSVLVVHHGGIGWHSGYFDVLGKGLEQHGIAVVAYDQIGSGHSDSMGGNQKHPSKNPIRGYCDSMDTIVNDLVKMIQDSKEKYKKPVFALGESFGGMILLHQIIRDQEKYPEKDTNMASGYILSGPAIRIKPEMLPPKPVLAIVKFLSRFFPLLKMKGTDFVSTFDSAFGDPRWAKAGRDDPFVQEAFVAQPRLGMLASVIRASENIWANRQEVGVPFAIFIGSNETRVDLPDSEELYKVAKSKDKTLNIIPSGHHQLYQDLPEVTKLVVDGVKDWILARI